MGIVYACVASVGMMGIIALGFNVMAKTTAALTPKTEAQLTIKERQEFQMANELTKLQTADYATLSDAQKDRLKDLKLLKPQSVHSHVNDKSLIWVVCLIVLIYATVGGLHAAFLTDTLQGVFIIILSVILLPFGWAKLNAMYGGAGVLSAFQHLHHYVPESAFDVFGSPLTVDFTWYFFLASMLTFTINVAAQPNQLVAIGSAKDEYTARFGYTSGIFLKRLLLVLWGLFGLFAIVLYTGKVNNPDLVWGFATHDLLGPRNLGLVGLMIACLMAALMATASCLMITSSGLLTHSVYRELLPNFSERHYVVVGRIIGAAVVIGAALMASQFETIISMMKFLWTFYGIFAASFWLGMLWRRATPAGAWTSILVTLTCFFVLPFAAPVICPGLRTNPNLTIQTQPVTTTRTYTAHKMDIDERNTQIAKWDTLNSLGKAKGPRPEVICEGQLFKKACTSDAKEIFWSQGIEKLDDGTLRGKGELHLDLLLLSKLGFDLTKNPYALNETIRFLLRIILPFAAIVIVSLFTTNPDKDAINRFYVKMKTEANIDREEDERELALSYANPHRFDHLKLFPNSNWEFLKMKRVDWLGFLICYGVTFAIIGLFFLVISIGK